MVSLDAVLEEQIAPKYQKKILFITSLMWMFDAAGVLVLSFTLPTISKLWNLDISTSANIISSTFFGMLVGALSVGIVSDVFGRKISNMIYFLFTVLFTTFIGFSNSPTQFIVRRFLAGVGYGGLMPSANAYLAEFTKKNLRGMYLVLLEASWAIGSIIIGLIAVLTVNTNWRISYFVFASGILLIPLLAKFPESPKFAFQKHGKKKLEELFPIETSDDIEYSINQKTKITEILKGQYLSRTIMIWVQWFNVSFTYYALFSWAPKIFAQKGLSSAKSLWFTFFMIVAQLPGYLSAAYFIEKIGRKKSLIIYTLGMALSALLWAFVSSEMLLIIVAILLSLFVLGTWGLVYAYTPELYPTVIRGTGNGMAGVVARIAGILAPQYAGFMLSKNKSLFEIFFYISLLSIVSTVVFGFLGVETKNRDID